MRIQDLSNSEDLGMVLRDVLGGMNGIEVFHFT